MLKTQKESARGLSLFWLSQQGFITIHLIPMKVRLGSLLFHQRISVFVGHAVFLSDVKHNDEGRSVNSLKAMNKYLRLEVG